MSGLTITCDRDGALWRVAVWQGSDVRDLYLDRIDRLNLAGAVVCAKIIRAVPAQKAAYVDFGEKGYVPGLSKAAAGDKLILQVKSPARGDKAAVLVPYPHAGLSVEKTGILVPPPKPWERAIADIGKAGISFVTFSHRDDHAACKDWLAQNRPELLDVLQPLAKESPHPDLPELIDSLLEPVMPLPGGGDIVVEPTAALVAIDVNAGENANPLAVNLQAVREAARQIRLRNLSGAIVIDCIGMKHRADNAKLLGALKKAVTGDPAGVDIFGMTKLGLIELTRTRRGPSLAEVLKEA